MICVECDNRLYAGPKRFHIDKFVCRSCQRNPALQLRVLLEDARLRGTTFEEAWAWALGDAPEYRNGRVRWPHDTNHRCEWKDIFDDLSTQDVWRGCYEQEPATEREKTLVHLAFAA